MLTQKQSENQKRLTSMNTFVGWFIFMGLISIWCMIFRLFNIFHESYQKWLFGLIWFSVGWWGMTILMLMYYSYKSKEK